jgi:hypothetical protein
MEMELSYLPGQCGARVLHGLRNATSTSIRNFLEYNGYVMAKRGVQRGILIHATVPLTTPGWTAARKSLEKLGFRKARIWVNHNTRRKIAHYTLLVTAR